MQNLDRDIVNEALDAALAEIHQAEAARDQAVAERDQALARCEHIRDYAKILEDQLRQAQSAEPSQGFPVEMSLEKWESWIDRKPSDLSDLDSFGLETP